MLKKILFLIIFLLGFSVLGAACSSSTTIENVVPDDDLVEEFEEEEEIEEPEFLPGEITDDGQPAGQPLIGEVNFGDEDRTFDDDTIDNISEVVRVFNLIVKKFEFVPNIIQVKKDNRVIINITSEYAEHSFVIKEYNINQIIPAGESARIEFAANQVGQFAFYSDIYAGVGSSSMRGKLIVE